ncbi:MAG: bifunctional [glutamate--ammonia ligase]-adenylyl-L-tyrosine phosphorylase/[glutamate--ammonia-ligase] adenylyltransferase [Gemmataceae bacterium]|nr:bifunctional [glutamate--ammonia ligase]-adenylyl-L-tyrosine phosphorylase/[glutamate--ammonia-ligase] adenylyltransferase [Gemmataceae bacterium]MCI0737492.1 bifunctional [glutamate--ammonia ligase]-adenylyl-L-tyrosine phosphorylase/[glutamate--ammonia-ligase] adenylyltransferase [Gemmataceae bacterium]
MHPDSIRRALESLDEARDLLQSWGVRDAERGQRNLASVAEKLGVDGAAELAVPLARALPRCPDPDMALNNLERFLTDPRGAQQLPFLLENRARTLDTLVQLFSSSQFFSDLLAANPDFLEMLRIPLRSSPSRAELLAQLQGEIDAAFEGSAVLKAFRRFRQKHLLRIGANDIIRDRPLEEITRDISRVADTALEVALVTALRNVGKRFGEPVTTQGEPARCVILAFGKLGGKELNYSSDIDLMFVYDEEGATIGKRVSLIGNNDFFSRVTTEVVRLLSTHTDRGQAYRVDLRLRPEGHRGPLARSLASTLAYYDTLGRTWERQALIKVRPVAGDAKLGEEFLRAIEPFVYRKYLSVAEINEIKALKRRIEHKTFKAGETDKEVKTGHGGIRDVEFTIQFLQLLNGGDLPAVRQRNTLKAIRALEDVGCLTDQEYRVLDDTYRFLRKAEHRLQLMFDLQTHRLPEREEELRKLALRMGYGPRPQGDDETPAARLGQPLPSAAARMLFPPADPLEAFLRDYREKTDANRTILDHLLHQMFQEQEGQATPESDLILDPSPDPERIQAVLGTYPFKDPQAAYNNLMQLATETVPFLSTRRCRQFLANIAPRLLRAVAETPDPDMALLNLEKVSASLGGKAVLWELFSFNYPSLRLYVELCAWSQFLSEILISNPGMVDELLDSLVLNQRRTAEDLRQELAELCRNADDPDPILHSFKDKELLRIGVRDILGKDTTIETTAALSDLAETILVQIAALAYPPLVKRLGLPTLLEEGPRQGQASRYAILGLGKLGGQEMSYHSDLDLIVVYEGDGRTLPPPGSSRWDTFELTANLHFFTEFTMQIIKVASYMGPMGRLYHVDMRLRPTGKSGSLVIPLHEFQKYYDASGEGGAQLWERQALTRARVVFGDPDFAEEVLAAVHHAAYDLEWQPELADEILSMRERVEASGSDRDLKRGFGGIIDIEFIVQMFRLKYGGEFPAVRHANTWQALESMRDAKLISEKEHTTLRECYDFLRLVESRLRIFHNRSLDELPESEEDIEKLARRVGCEGTLGQTAGQKFHEEMERHATQTRQLFLELFQREKERRGPY